MASSRFVDRHIGPSNQDIEAMLGALSVRSLDELIEKSVPKAVRSSFRLDLGPGLSEYEFLNKARTIASFNQVFKSYIGQGYYGTVTPTVILRNILENPGWYTAYTPYQAEISQGRMEALLNFQTMVSDLTGLPIANASLLDEATAAAEAMSLSFHSQKKNAKRRFLVDDDVFAQTLAVLKTRARPLGIEIVTGSAKKFSPHDLESCFAVYIQMPTATGEVVDWSELIKSAHQSQTHVIVAADIMALALMKTPGEMGADIAVGSTQRFGVPMGFGGPHAAYIATQDEFLRLMPGRLIGVSKDAQGQPALRLTLQTREQHIRREKATSNICTAQVLLAVMASMYAVYHGQDGLRSIAQTIHGRAQKLASALAQMGLKVRHARFFDTVCLKLRSNREVQSVLQSFQAQQINLGDGRILGPDHATDILISIDETTSDDDVSELIEIFRDKIRDLGVDGTNGGTNFEWPANLHRETKFLTHPIFNKYHSETEMLRYIHRLENKDLALNQSMIPLGSCTMKLNAATEMLPITWPELSRMHPFAPESQTRGYMEIIHQLENWLMQMTGFSAVSLQPNAGSQGEYSGLLAIRAYHESRGDHRDLCLIPTSAHGTNPASAVMAGFRVMPIACDKNGNIDLDDLRTKASQNKDHLAALMVTYPSTHGVFEETIADISKIIHENGGQVYMDGANFNALVGIARPSEFGADVCHLNLHKTFCIPHGGGGPGVGPIAVAAHLRPFLPKAVAAAPFGSANILPISWAYMAMMGGDGLTRATQVAILNANYLAARLAPYYPILYRGRSGWVAHECIIDARQFKTSADITVDDIAKRLMDYGFHAPTMSWPVAGTLMIEPTESESKEELDRFCDAMIAICEEIRSIENGKWSRTDNPLKNAPHTLRDVTSDNWTHPYSREVAVYPLSWVRERKFWPAVARVDNVYGDRNIVCSCPTMDQY